MRSRKKDQKNLVKVGIFMSFLTGIIMIIIVAIGKESSIFEPKADIRAIVGNVSNLKPGSYVELKGIRIGSVTDISIVSEDEVQITMRVLAKELKWVKQDSRVSISTAGLVGDKFVEIYKGTKTSKAFDPEKDMLISEEVADFKQIITKGESIATVTERILIKVDQLLYNLGDGKVIVDTLTSLNRSSLNLEKITTDINKANLGQMVGNVNKSTASLDRILTRVEKGPGSMNSLIYNEGVHDDLRALLGGAQRNKVIKYFIRESIKKSEERKPVE
jgi:phospholipid/cholesterol/gamma-HCH transport system substrate-binding protein